MTQPPVDLVPKWVFGIMNNLFEMEKKIELNGDSANLQRHIERMKDLMGTEKVFFENPIGERFSETRTDLEATITGADTDDLYVIEVIKPIIRIGDRSYSRVVQKGIVVVESGRTKTPNGESNV